MSVRGPSFASMRTGAKSRRWTSTWNGCHEQ
jgi:hypothetical protein